MARSALLYAIVCLAALGREAGHTDVHHYQPPWAVEYTDYTMTGYGVSAAGQWNQFTGQRCFCYLNGQSQVEVRSGSTGGALGATGYKWYQYPNLIQGAICVASNAVYWQELGQAGCGQVLVLDGHVYGNCPSLRSVPLCAYVE